MNQSTDIVRRGCSLAKYGQKAKEAGVEAAIVALEGEKDKYEAITIGLEVALKTERQENGQEK